VEIDFESRNIGIRHQAHPHSRRDPYVIGRVPNTVPLPGLRRRGRAPDLLISQGIRTLDLTGDPADTGHSRRNLDRAQVSAQGLRRAAQQYYTLVHGPNIDIAALE